MYNSEKRRFDGEKTKRHIITDTIVNLLAVHVHAENVHDTKGGVFTFEKALFYYPPLVGGCADNAYRKHFKNTFETFYNINVDISERLESTFKVMPKRCKVERTFSTF